MKYLVLAAAAAYVAAECPNACSGNGECGTKDQCVCYDGFIGADCSQRVCPFSRAFVDVPNGDLNHDGVLAGKKSTYSKVSWSRYQQPEYWPTKADKAGIAYSTVTPTSDISYRGVDASKTVGLGWVAAKNEAHWAQECSGKGFCDRTVGECVCFDGYTGSSCQRTTCPNDCSGHGRCKTVGDIAAGALNKKFVDSYGGENFFSGVEAPFEYRLWDSDKNQACVCDTGYGGVDCSLRECPRGDDPLTAVPATCGGKDCDNEVQTFILQGTDTNDGTNYKVMFSDYNGAIYSSKAFKFATKFSAAADAKTVLKANAAEVEAALEAIPNEIVGKNVTVSAEPLKGGDYTNVVFKVTFTDLSGNVPEFSVVQDDAKKGLPAVAQPSQPIQTIDLATASDTDKLVFSFMDDSDYRASQLEATLVTADLGDADKIAARIADASAVKYELGSTPATVIKDGDKYHFVFSKNANRPMAARRVGTNPIRLVDAAGATEATATVWSKNGNTEYSICSNRGVCDFSSGVCACFPGYTGEACSSQNALAM